MEVEIAESEPIPGEVRALLESLPDWFGDPPSIDMYVADAQRMPTLAARDAEGALVGALVHHRHFPETAEIHLMAVARGWHRRGVGRALVERVAALVSRDGASLLTVKTLGPSRPDPNYARTRAFYRACGFSPIEEFADLWPGNPCLMLVHVLGR